MQDKKRINQGDLSVDRAWEDMLKILDKEMPVEAPPRRRIIAAWWWTAAAACLAGGILVVTLIARQQPGKIPVTVEMSVVESAREQSAQNQQALLDNQCPENDVDAELSPANFHAPVEFPATALPVTNSIFKNLGDNLHQINVDKRIEIADILPPSSKVSEVQNQSSVLANATNSQVITQANTTSNSVEEIGALPLVDHLQAKRLAAKEINLHASPIKHKIGFPISLTASGLSSFPVSVGGFMLSIQTEQNLSSKFFLQPALGYRFQRQALTVQFVDTTTSTNSSSSVELNDALGGFGVASSVVENAGSGNEIRIVDYPTVLKSHIVDASCSVGYRLSSRWQLDAGAEVSYLAQVFEGSPEMGSLNADFDSQGGSYTPLRASESNWFSSKALEKVDVANFRRLDVGICAGITYKVSKKIGLRAEYRQGLVDMLRSDRYTLRNQYIALGGVWAF